MVKLNSPSSIVYPRPVFIAGPTAVGKSEIVLALAEKIDGEIISVDSMQVYRGLDIGTAKPNASEQKRVRHHLINVAELNEPFDAAQFVSLAQKAVAEIQARNHTPIFCGGTGLYFKAFLEGLGEAPSSDTALRAELEATPLLDLLRELEQHDPITFAKIDKKNPRRVIRAVEVIRLTGRPFSEQRSEWTTEAAHKEVVIGLMRESKDLHARINLRVDEMFRRGLVEETRTLLKHGLEQNKTALQAIGYRQVVEHLRGERPLPETIELVKIKTRQFAKRQMTWFRRQLKMEWIQFSPLDHSSAVVTAILTSLK
ncbi:MAG TPA: tRNA (adenosine(37)-N6)-dimethylallyltransferase MiaA [Verrucomicrobiae bacterium]|nr:tRNA (adenosine(37)-N6)-dimethylallyltransferase MiaA [Verrucomicrobiae bacterium]